MQNRFFFLTRLRPEHRCWLLLASFCALYLLSALLYRQGTQQRSYTLLFPSANSQYFPQERRFTELYAEQRKIPIPQVLPDGWHQRQRQLYYLVKELLYGPGAGAIRSYPFVPFRTKLLSLAIQNDDVYLNFDRTLRSGQSEHHFTTEAVLALTEKVLRLNFPSLQGIYFTAEGLLQTASPP